MPFIKYTHKFAHGYGQPEYRFVHEDTPTEELIEMLEEEHNWSDKYRGVDWEFVDRPPQDWTDDEIRDTRLRIISLNAYLAILGDPMAVAPNGYNKSRTSVTYESWTHGRLTIYFDQHGKSVGGDPVSYPLICGMWEPNDDRQSHNCRLWEDGKFRDHDINRLAELCSTDRETMAHWLKEEILKFANMQAPVEVE